MTIVDNREQSFAIAHLPSAPLGRGLTHTICQSRRRNAISNNSLLLLTIVDNRKRLSTIAEPTPFALRSRQNGIDMIENSIKNRSAKVPIEFDRRRTGTPCCAFACALAPAAADGHNAARVSASSAPIGLDDACWSCSSGTCCLTSRSSTPYRAWYRLR